MNRVDVDDLVVDLVVDLVDVGLDVDLVDVDPADSLCGGPHLVILSFGPRGPTCFTDIWPRLVFPTLAPTCFSRLALTALAPTCFIGIMPSRDLF